MPQETIYKKIKSIKKIRKKQKVYNFDVPVYENYIANGFIVHNCINFPVSQELNLEKRSSNNNFYSPEDLVQTAKRKEARGIVFTYNEPTIHFEYLYNVGCYAIASNLCLAAKTNGFVTEYALRGFGALFDAFNVDIKGDEAFYQKYCGGSFKPVRDTIETIISMGLWLEISYLVPPPLIDNLKWHEENARWLASLNKSMPVHLLYFYPYHKLRQSYPCDKLLTIYKIMSCELEHVYISNTYDTSLEKYRNTRCPVCGDVLISRNSEIKKMAISCCGKNIEGIWS